LEILKVVNSAQHTQTLVDVHFPISTDAAFWAVILIWSLWGLWLYLDARGHGDRLGVIAMLIFGPAAWVTVVWYLTHRRLTVRKKQVQQSKVDWEHWGRN
jgi:hypothetical protein